VPHKGLEESSIPLTVNFGRLLASYGTWAVTHLIDLSSASTPAWPLVDKGSRKFLAAVQAGILTEGARQQTVAPNVDLKYTCTLEGIGDAFELNDIDDPDWGGWVLDELERNLRLCIDEKTRKSAPYRSRYPEWWLVLVAQAAYQLAERNTQHFRESTHIAHDWDKIVIVNHVDHTRYFEL